jgi:haloalkane dehalogenase
MTLAFREAGEPGAPVALLVHGYPNSSYLFRDVMPAVAAAGWRAIAPDLPGFGDTPLGERSGTWEEHVEALDEFVAEQELGPVALIVHDWGGLIGLRWAVEHPGAARALVIMSSGFFPDGKWHGLARAMRQPGELDGMMEAMTRDAFEDVMRQVEPHAGPEAVAEYWKGFATREQRLAHLELYRSGDFSKLAPYEGALAALGVPTLLLWGATDDYAPLAGAHRFAREIPHAELVVLDDAGHFLMEDAPQRVGDEIGRFLSGVGR